MLVIALIAGIAGGLLSYFLFKASFRELLENSGRPSVTINTVESFVSGGGGEVSAAYGTIYEQVAAQASLSVVEVVTESRITHPIFGSFVTGGAGSGVIISDDGYIVTNNHVISGSSSILVRTHEGLEFDARLVGTDVRTDLALIKIEAQYLHPAVFAESDRVRSGQPVMAIGNPLGNLGGTVTDGIISARDREILIEGEYMALLQTSAAINPGNSGGGLFDLNGSLVGVVNAKSSGNDIEGLGFAIPADTVKAVITQLIEHGYVTGRPALGVGVTEIRSRSALYMYRLREAGVYVTSAEGPAELKKWDRIVSIGGTAVNSAADVKKIVGRHAVGESLDVQVRRNGRTMDITVMLEEDVPGQVSGESV
ncbi:trypsin-like peptidase domain-containing protein [Treponema sp. OttesenSCG-928-L16]|nr:trypsin-like peptidase domain-containing protein [Treponema sp. OttesenSCG-928-L16]